MKTFLLALAVVCAIAGAARAEDAPLSHEEISGAVNSHLADLKACIHENGAGKGRLVVDFVIKPDGTAINAKPKQSSSNGALDKCIAGKFLTWKFPKPRGSVMMEVVYPFDFTPPPPKPANLETQEIAETVRNHQVDIVGCYNESLLKKADLGDVGGIVNVDIVVGPTGQVVETKVHDSTMKFPLLETCIATKVKAWQFPKPDGAGNFSFTFPFKFQKMEKKKKDDKKKEDEE